MPRGGDLSDQLDTALTDPVPQALHRPRCEMRCQQLPPDGVLGRIEHLGDPVVWRVGSVEVITVLEKTSGCWSASRIIARSVSTQNPFP